MSKNALGKGLGALISGAVKRGPGAAPLPAGETAPAENTDAEPGPDAANAGSPGERVVQVPLSSIVASPLQPRKTFRDEHIDELLESIREHGIIQPLIVRRVHGKLELIAGERRFRASQKLGLTEVPVIERSATDRDVLEMALIENLQREDLNPVEEAEAYCRLAKEFAMRQEDIAKRVGKNRATVANSMRLVELTSDAKSLLAQGRISTGHAKAILGLRDADLQNMVAEMIVRQNLTVRQTEKQVQKELDSAGTPRPGKNGAATATPAKAAAGSPKEVQAVIQSLQNKLRNHLATQVAIHHGDKKGRIEIEYYGNDDLNRVLEVLGISAD